MKRVIQGIILTIEMLFETVTIIGTIGAAFSSYVTPVDGILFCSIVVLWFVVTLIGFFELSGGRKWIILPALGIKLLMFLFFCGLLGVVELGEIELGVFLMVLSAIFLIPVCIRRLKGMPKRPAATPAPAGYHFNKYRFDGFRSKHHWDDAAMEELGAKKVTEENSDQIYILASTYFSYLLVWLIKNGLVNESYRSVFGDEIRNMELELVNPAQLFMDYTDGNLLRGDLTGDGAAFLDSYYYEREYKTKYNTSYETDYAGIVQDENHLRIYHDFSWDVYHSFEKLLNERYKYYKINEEFSSEEAKRTYDDSGEHIDSGTFKQPVEIIAFSGVADEYKDRCIRHIKQMPRICYDRTYWKIDELWGFDEGTDPDTLWKDTSAMTVIIPKPYGEEIAYVLEFEADFEPEHGVSVLIRNDIVIDVGIRDGGYSPWSWEAEINYRYETGR
mgnify:CR=1 FL=1